MLRARDQALLDAIAPGNRKPWEQALADHAIYVDENGTVMDRATFLHALVPLPAGASGSLVITDYRVHVSGDTAIVVHTDDEHETFHGQKLRAGYLMTETWQHRANGWKLLLVHAYVINKDPPAVTLPPAQLADYVGRYRAAPDLVFVIRREGDHLVGGTEGKPARPLEVELRDVVFSPGRPRSREIFERDSAGHVSGFIDRREGEDLRYTRLR